ncbi:AfsR/SARP family transcriptional regulator [Nonomuraea jabiensis]|uniref:DNA-binding SARP family transcriptional activator n=1 Tax=Nonomuraea jabiensis TaxID=882448 RepID=A0A7W9GFR7_9ACTN|nr:BTAD domain-containing putative transcriptional regulator [Nonomuraea jabiensis]MBB5782858.1 DNA-binding SARP family transcriptional activator [Nonomuraea jabiensis]
MDSTSAVAAYVARPEGSVSLRLLGTFEVSACAETGGARWGELPHSARRLVAFLGLHGTATRDFAAGSLWPDSSEAHAQADLRTTLWRAGRACPGLIVTGGAAMRLDSRVSVDVDELQALSRRLHVRRPAQAEDDGSWVPPRGVLLPGWYDEWVVAVRERVRQLQLHTLEAMAERQLTWGAYGRALDLALAAVEYEPLRESSQRLVVRIHLAEGNLVEAVRAVRAFTELLWREIKVRPSPEFAGLIELPAPS